MPECTGKRFQWRDLPTRRAYIPPCELVLTTSQDGDAGGHGLLGPADPGSAVWFWWLATLWVGNQNLLFFNLAFFLESLLCLRKTLKLWENSYFLWKSWQNKIFFWKSWPRAGFCTKAFNLFWLLCVGLPGDAQAVEIPRAEMEVVKGQMAVLHAWYSPGSDISKNSVTWQIFGNGTKPVRTHLLRIQRLPEQNHNSTKTRVSFARMNLLRWKPDWFNYSQIPYSSQALAC